MCRVVAGESRRRDEGECDHEAYPKRTDEGEQELPEAERQCSGDEADDDRAEPACTGLIGPCPGATASEEWPREDCQCEQQPAQRADRRDAGADANEAHRDRTSTRMNSRNYC